LNQFFKSGLFKFRHGGIKVGSNYLTTGHVMDDFTNVIFF
jgi:hypothetical protein